jgi:uncharacterized membrane protein
MNDCLGCVDRRDDCEGSYENMNEVEGGSGSECVGVSMVNVEGMRVGFVDDSEKSWNSGEKLGGLSRVVEST